MGLATNATAQTLKLKFSDILSIAVHDARKKKGWSYRQVEKKTKIPAATVFRVEWGIGRIKYEAGKRLETWALGVLKKL